MINAFNILIWELVILAWLLVEWGDIERKWSTIYISHEPSKYWNHVYIPPNMNASHGIQSAIDFLNRRGGELTFATGTFCVEESIVLGGGNICIRGEVDDES